MNVVSGEEQGLSNFESIVSCYFDKIDTRIRGFHNNVMLGALDQAKQEYMEQSVREITNDLGCLSMQDREEIYAREEFQEIVTYDKVCGERQLEVSKENIDKIIQFQNAIEEKLKIK